MNSGCRLDFRNHSLLLPPARFCSAPMTARGAELPAGLERGEGNGREGTRRSEDALWVLCGFLGTSSGSAKQVEQPAVT